MAAPRLLGSQYTEQQRSMATTAPPPTQSAVHLSSLNAAPALWDHHHHHRHQHHLHERDHHPLLSNTLRRGKWTPEEERYAAAIIQYFLTGILPIQYGTTLRGYIAQLLHCDPMRVSKKLVPGSMLMGIRIDPKIGRRSYYPCPADTPMLDSHKQNATRHLIELRGGFIQSIEREDENDRLAREYSPRRQQQYQQQQYQQQQQVDAVYAPESKWRSPPRVESSYYHHQHHQHHDYNRSYPSASILETNKNGVSVVVPVQIEEEEEEAEYRPTSTIGRTPSLPSLTEMLRQHRLREPTSTPTPTMIADQAPTSHSQAQEVVPHGNGGDETGPLQQQSGFPQYFSASDDVYSTTFDGTYGFEFRTGDPAIPRPILHDASLYLPPP